MAPKKKAATATGGPILDLIAIIRDMRAFVAASKAGNWFGPDGALKKLAALIEYLAAVGVSSDDLPKIFGAAQPEQLAELEQLLAEFKVERGVFQQNGIVDEALPAVSGWSPALTIALLDGAEKIISFLIDLYKKNQEAE